LLQVDDAQVRFGGVKALDGTSLEVAPGQLLGLIGPNGSGKSTLIGAISRLTPLTAGRLVIEGRDYTRSPAHQASALGIARTFQTVRLLDTMNVIDNVTLGAEGDAIRHPPVLTWLASGRRSSARAIAEQALERVGMSGAARARPQDLPYGSQRRVEIARALACRPKLLLLDEPTAGMNHSEREEVGDLLIALRDDGLTQILVEHDLAMIHRVSSMVVALNFGKVIARGSSRDVAADEQVREAYLGQGSSAQDTAAATAPEARS
jgi:ABC-type branched-subunit amino acid transport system ATPase component